MSILKFLSKKSTVLSLGLLVLFTFMLPVDAWAATLDVGPFQKFLGRAAKLFDQTRNAIYILAVFAFIAYAFTAIQKGSVEWEKIFYLIVGLVILGVAGWTMSYLADPEDEGNAIIRQYKELDNVGNWGDKQ